MVDFVHMEIKGVYAGTFDPFTEGHLHVLKQAMPMFDRIVVSIGVNPAKKVTYSLEDRLSMLRDIAHKDSRKISVTSFDSTPPNGLYLVDYAESVGATHIIRGLRNSADFEYELSLAQVNKVINPKIRTVFFLADREYADVSSSMVKSLIGPKDWEKVVANYIPHLMWDRFIKITKGNL